MRKGIEDIWGAQDSVAILQACLRKALRGEAYLTDLVNRSATTNTVTGVRLQYTGSIDLTSLSQALNENP